MSNAPDRHEAFLLAEGEEKITWVHETRVPNATLFTFNKEDHTLANAIRDKMSKDPRVIFVAYQVPHPLFAMFKLRIVTDGTVTPSVALSENCQMLVQDLGKLSREFTKEFELYKIAHEGEGGAAADGNGAI